MTRNRNRIVGLYEDNAEAWDQQRGRDLFERPWLDKFIARLPPAAEILDGGCGMGEPIASYLISGGLRVTGIDSSASLIAMARSRFADAQWEVADLRDLHFGRRFDGIVAWHSLIHLSPGDQGSRSRVWRSTCDREGVLLFTSGHEHGESIGEWQAEPLYHASLDPGEYRALLKRNGLAIVDHHLRDPDCGTATVWLAQMSPASGLDGSA